MDLGQELHAFIRSQVQGRVPSTLVEKVTEIVGLTVVHVMSDQRFFQALPPVQRLLAENQAMRQQLAMLTAHIQRMSPGVPGFVVFPARKAPARKRVPAKKVPVKRAPTTRTRRRTI